MFKKTLSLILAVFLLNSILFSNVSLAWDSNWVENQVVSSKYDIELDWGIVFKYIWDVLLKDIPESYKYIKLDYLDLKEGLESYKNVQKLVYANVLPNKKVKINFSSKVNSYYFFKIVSYITWFDFITEKNISILKSRNVKYSDLLMINEVLLQDEQMTENQIKEQEYYSTLFQTPEEKKKFQIYMDVYNTLLKDYYNSYSVDKNKLIYSSIEWLAEWSDDKFTTFFPPTEAKDFEESLSWEFEWIWAYVDMEKPWELRIISPLSGSPAEKAWLKWWDIITKIDWFEITKTMTVNEAVAKIKWPTWTKVKLNILRDWQEIELEIIRAKIIIKDVEYKNLNNNFFYIQMRMFWDNVFKEFNNSLDELKKSWLKKIIIDLRNNPWWYLDQVAEILSLFVKKWESTAVVKYKDSNEKYISYWYDKVDLGGYQVYILANSGTASASEIMIATLKDYFPNIKVIWEKTYWKWSVQTIKTYYDWSSFKYTIAKWFSGKNEIWIDKVWISPDIEVVLDTEKFKNWEDNQLNYILQNY